MRHNGLKLFGRSGIGGNGRGALLTALLIVSTQALSATTTTTTTTTQANCVAMGGVFGGATSPTPLPGQTTAPTGPCQVITVTPDSANAAAATTQPTVNSSAPLAAAFISSQVNQAIRTVSQASLGAVNAQVRNIRDRLQAPLATVAGFVTGSIDTISRSTFTQYSADLPGRRTAVAPEPVQIPPRFAVWAQGFGDYENRSQISGGINLGRQTYTTGVVGGFDATFVGITSSSDALVIGLLGGDTMADIRNKDGSRGQVNGPSVGIYGVYVNGGFSTDGTFKTDFLSANQTGLLATSRFGLTNYNASGNINYKYELTSFWIEPTVGLSYTWANYDAQSRVLGIKDGTEFRVQGGFRIGTVFDYAGVKIEPTVTGLAYSDVSITGSQLLLPAGAGVLRPADEGKVFGQGIFKLNVDFNNGLAAYVEGEVRGRSNVIGTAGRGGLRYSF